MPDGLLTQFAAVKADAERSMKASAEHEAAGRLEQAVEHLSDITRSARALAAMIQAYDEAGIVLPAQPQLATSLRESAVRLRAEEPDPARTGSPSEAAQQLASDIRVDYNAAQGSLDAALESARTRWIDEQPSPNSAFLAVFRRLAPRETATAESAAEEFDELAALPVSRPTDVRRLKSASDRLLETYKELTGRAPVHVRDFLERIPTGVSLAEVPDSVLTWLRDNKADGAFSVFLRSE
jgi:hypothetical protein